MNDFSMRRTLGSALGFLVTDFWPITGFLVQAFVLTVVAYTAVLQFLPVDISSWIASISFAPVSVLIHRRIVLGQEMYQKHYLLEFGQGRLWRFIGWGVLASLLIGALALLGFGAAVLASMFLEANALILMGLGPAAFAFAAVAFLFRYAFTFPAVATDNFQSLRDVRNLMRGLTFKVFVVMLVIVLVGTIVTTLAEFTDSIIIGFPLLVLSVYFAALVPAALSFAYTEACETGAESGQNFLVD